MVCPLQYLLPLLLGPESFRLIGLVVGGIWAALLIKQAVSVIGVPGASRKVTTFIITTTVVIYGQFIASAMALIGVTIQQSYLTLILWNLAVAALFFVRALRSMSPA